MGTVLITSFANPTVKRFKALAAKKHRRREAAFTVEGLQPVWRAVTASDQPKSPWRIDTVIISPDLLTHEPTWQMLDRAEREGAAVIRVSREVFAHLSDRDGPAGIAAIIAGEIASIATLDAPANGPVVALHQVGNPGNIGTILRSADAAGAGGLIVIGACADPLAPLAVKASMGSVFAVPIGHAADAEEFFAWAADQSRPVIAVTGNTATSLWRTAVDPRAVLLFGSEGDGLSDGLVARCDAAVRIPMQGTAESLNLATAASVALFEHARRRDLGDCL